MLENTKEAEKLAKTRSVNTPVIGNGAKIPALGKINRMSSMQDSVTAAKGYFKYSRAASEILEDETENSL